MHGVCVHGVECILSMDMVNDLRQEKAWQIYAFVAMTMPQTLVSKYYSPKRAPDLLEKCTKVGEKVNPDHHIVSGPKEVL